MIIGGVAASLLGTVRATVDVDAVVWLPEDADWRAFIDQGRAHGIAPRIAGPLAFARRTRVLLMKHSSTGVELDVSLASLEFERLAIGRAVSVRLGTRRLPIAAPEDLVILKAVAHRPRDTADIEALLTAHPAMDRHEIQRWVREFAYALEEPSIASDLEALLERVPPRAVQRTRRPAKTTSGPRRRPKAPTRRRT
jgi:hypothetical protein